VVASPPKIKPKMTISSFEKFFFVIKSSAAKHKFITIGIIAGTIFAALYYSKNRVRRGRGGFFKLDEKDGLLGGIQNGVKGD
jgi:protein disulfide-isomerase